MSTNGHLVFQTGENHNITFRSSQGGFVNVDGENINAIVQLVSKIITQFYVRFMYVLVSVM